MCWSVLVLTAIVCAGIDCSVIALSKPSYGIHGTPEPSEIGKAASHGCVRLTNWDAARLAALVKPGTPVTFK